MKSKLIIGVIIAVLYGGVYLNTASNKNELKDGIYKVYSESYEEAGYKPFVVLEVKKGRIIDALVDYVNKDGELLTKNRVLKHAYYEQIGNFPEGFTKEIRADLLIKQNTNTLDKATNNNIAVKVFKQLIDELISKRIKEGKEEPLTIKIVE